MSNMSATNIVVSRSSNRANQTAQFELSNRSSLAISLHGDKKPWRRRIDLAMWPVFKENMPKLHLWSANSDVQLVAVDFDKLPDDFSTYRSDDMGAGWDGFRRYLKHVLGGKAHVTTSATGKAKVLFAVKLVDHEDTMSKQMALDFIEKHIPSHLFDLIDKSKSALNSTFLTESMADELSTVLRTLKPIEAVYDQWAHRALKNEKHTFRSVEGLLPAWATDFVGRSKGRDKFVRILLACRGLLREPRGFGLSSLKLAKQLDVSGRTVRDWIAELKETGLLIPARNGLYVPGARAKAFIAVGELRASIEEFQPLRGITPDAPSTISDGEWNEVLVEWASKFSTSEEYLAWVESVPGSNLNGRMKKAMQISNSCRRHRQNA